MKVRLYILSVLMMFLSFISCNSNVNVEASAKPSDTITIGIKDVFLHKDPDFTLQVDSILNDSRCPYGAECIWAGNAEVRVKLVVENSNPILFKLNTLQNFGQEVQLNRMTYKLIDLFPHPDIHTKFSYQNYRVKIYYSTLVR